MCPAPARRLLSQPRPRKDDMRISWRRHLVVGLGTALAASLAAFPVVTAGARDAPPARQRAVTASWDGGDGPVATGSLVTGTVRTGSPEPRGMTLTVQVRGGVLTGIPLGCIDSSVTRKRSTLSQSATTLVCQVKQPGRPGAVRFGLRVTADMGEQVVAVVRSGRSSTTLPARTSVGGRAAPERTLRLLSSPDFLNADVADLRRGPGFWRPARSQNSINDDYRRVLDTVLDDWDAQGSSGVLVAGDLVEGWWGTDRTGSGNFGPVRTPRQQRAALQRAAATYYPAWRARFASRGLPVFPAMGDHEYGDDPWDAAKLGRAPAFESAFARHVMAAPGGGPRFADRPRGSVHERSAYAWRPRADVQVVTLNMFDVTSKRMRLRLDGAQMRWLVKVLAKARRDGVRWTVVQGHLPVVGPVRIAGSSGLFYEGGRSSRLWQVFRQYGVDVYLSGEVHDVTAVSRDGILQVSHGGLFQFGRTNYLTLDFHEDRLEMVLRDFDIRWRDARDGSRLWETRPDGMPKILRVGGPSFGIGTAVLEADGTLTRSGILRRYRGS